MAKGAPVVLSVDVVKRSGERPTEQYERAKLERSLYATLRSVRTPDGQATDTLRAVCDVVEQWVSAHTEITSADIRRQAAVALHTLHPDAAFLYKHHKMIL